MGRKAPVLLHEIDALKICVEALDRVSSPAEKSRIVEYLEGRLEYERYGPEASTAAENWTQERVVEFIREKGSATVAELKQAGAQHGWVHNNLRILLERGELVRIGKGRYQAGKYEEGSDD